MSRGARPPTRRGHSLHVDAEMLSARLAREAARAQRCCQNPECSTPMAEWAAHHVVYEQEVRRLGARKWDTDNVLRLCLSCHRRHHHRIYVLPLTMLTQANLDYAFRLMGERAFDYLHRRYNGRDPRLKEMLRACRADATAE